MATKPITNPVADLPENWTNSQIVSANGTEAGLSQQHGYNHLMEKVNEALEDLGDVNDAFEELLTTGDESATKTSGPADVVEITDAAEAEAVSLIAQIVPVQDLNGYGYPWPAGGGKNKLPMTLANIKALNTAGTWSDNDYSYSGITFTVITDDGGNVERIDAKGTATVFVGLQLCGSTSFGAQDVTLNGCPTGGSSTTYDIAAFDDSVSPVANKGNDYGGNGVAFTAESGHTYYVRIAIRNGYAISGTISFYPMIRLSTEADATFAPYSNICPITGWTGANIFVSDRVQLVAGNRAGYNINADGSMSSSYDYRLYYAPVVQGKKYYIVSHDTANSGNGTVIGFYTTEPSSGTPKTYNNSRSIVTVGTVVEAPITGWIAFRSVRTQQGDEACWLTDAYNIDWTDEAGTVYGGKFDLDKVYNQKVYRAFTGTENWTSAGSVGNGLRYTCNRNTYLPNASTVGQLSSHLRYSANNGNWGVYRVSTSNIVISDEDGHFGDVESFKTWLAEQYAAGTPLVIMTTRATSSPNEHSISVPTISTLKGSNSISADCGPVTLTYMSEGLLTDADYTNLVQQIADKSIAYPLVSAPAWNAMQQVGSVTPAITLPDIGTPSTAQEFRYIFEAATANASFTAPSGVYLTDGSTKTAAGGTLAYTDLTVGSVYECSFAVLTSTLIAVVMKEWA